MFFLSFFILIGTNPCNSPVTYHIDWYHDYPTTSKRRASHSSYIRVVGNLLECLYIWDKCGNSTVKVEELNEDEEEEEEEEEEAFIIDR